MHVRACERPYARLCWLVWVRVCVECALQRSPFVRWKFAHKVRSCSGGSNSSYSPPQHNLSCPHEHTCRAGGCLAAPRGCPLHPTLAGKGTSRFIPPLSVPNTHTHTRARSLFFCVSLWDHEILQCLHTLNNIHGPAPYCSGSRSMHAHKHLLTLGGGGPPPPPTPPPPPSRRESSLLLGL